MVNSYVFTRVPYRDIHSPPSYLRSDPFLSLPPGEELLYSYQPQNAISLEIADVNPNPAVDRVRGPHFDTEDAYFIRTNGRRYSIDAETGLRVLRYFNDPNALREKQAVRFLTLETNSTPAIRSHTPLEVFSEAEQREIQNPTSLFLQTGGVDLCFLEGACTYTAAEFENRRGHNWNAMVRNPILDFRGARIGGNMAITSVGFLGLLAGLETFFSVAFSWTSAVFGFLIRAGSFSANDSRTQALDATYLFASQGNATPNLARRRANYAMDQNLLELEEDRFNWELTAPLAIGALFLERNARRFMWPPQNLPRNLSNYYGPRWNNFSGAFRASPFATVGVGMSAGLATNEIYRDLLASTHMFDYGSPANDYLSGALGAYTTTLIIAKSSEEIYAITGTRNLLRGMQILVRTNPQLAMRWTSAPFQSMGVQFLRVPTPSIVTVGGETLATAEVTTVAAEASLGVAETGALAAEGAEAVTLAVEGAAAAEGGEVVVAAGLTLGMTVALGILVVAGIGIGIYYLCDD